MPDTTATTTTPAPDVPDLGNDPAHARRVVDALDVLVGAVQAFADAGDTDAGLVAFARATVELRARLVAEHGEDAGGRAWRDGMALLRWRSARPSGAAS